MKNIAIGSDHAGFELKELLKSHLKKHFYNVLDFGTFNIDSVDYPDFAYPTAEAVASQVSDYGILICGSGIGVSIVANKVKGIRAALCCNQEMAKMARMHNNANIICLGARAISADDATKIIDTFFATEFEGGRHIARVNKIHSISGI